MMMHRLHVVGQVFLYALVVLAGPAWADAQEKSRPLGVLTTNLQHKTNEERLRLMADTLRMDLYKVPDFILCQEVMFKRVGRYNNTAEIVAASLGYYSRGTKRSSDREGIAIVSKYPFAYYNAIEYDAQTASFLLGFKRVAVMGEFMVPDVGRVRVVNIHLTNWGFERHIRRQQIAETLEWIEKRQKQVPAAVTFLGGDFNAEMDWSEMAPFRSPRANSMAFRSYNSDEPSKGSKGDPDIRIDMIFVSAPGMKSELVEEKLLWKDGVRDGRSRFYPSDHLAVSHVYSFAKPTSLAEIE